MRQILLGFMILSTFSASAQIANPVKWNYTAKKTADKTYEIYFSASIDPGWHLYAQEPGEGPEPTTFAFTKNPLVTPDGSVKEMGKMVKEYDPNFNTTLKYYSNKVDFVQKVKLKTNAATVVKGTITYMVCNDKKCLPPRDIPFSVKVQGK
ncbi:MAG: hypothetical protein KF829_08330 [Ferruginibacter sp.]|nr:hypothetical protein [Ferruginibacter sp.]